MKSPLPQVARVARLNQHALRNFLFIVCGMLFALFHPGAWSRGTAQAKEPVDFQSSIAPILAEHCNHCHGGDEKTRQGGLRLDTRDGATTLLDSGMTAIAPGDASRSELLHRIRSESEGEIMPPPSENRPLSKEQISLLESWIEQGAPYEAHWGFVAPVRPDVPDSPASNPIDRFVESKAAQKSLDLTTRADDAALIRRLYLDVIGLPPSPNELAEAQKVGYQATLDKLLTSDRYGEKWGRAWLDLARFSDTNGYEKDMPREQWKYRDWVIDAINRDMPYDQFVIEQIAGDLLPNATQSQIVATGFLRNSMINEEGAIVPEQFRQIEMFDRIDCIGKAVLGITAQCAQCHSHKFDPISHDEYFGMFAYINNSYEAQSWVYSDEQLLQLTSIRERLSALANDVTTARPTWNEEIQKWSAEAVAQQSQWKILPFHQRESVSGLNHPTQESDGSILMRGHVSNDVFLVSKPGASTISSLRLEILPHGDMPFDGPGRSSTGTWDISGIELWVRPPEAKEFTKLNLVEATADFSNAERKSADEKKKSGPVAFLIDNNGETSWTADRGVGRRNQASVAIVNLETPIALQEEAEIKFVMNMGEMVGCCRVSVSDQPKRSTENVDYEVQQILATPLADWTSEERARVLLAWARRIRDTAPHEHPAADMGAIAEGEEAIWKEFPTAATSILHLREREPENRRTTHLLDRGEWNLPMHEVSPHVPAEFHPLPEGPKESRLTFAKWLVDKDSPVAARVAVNRIWQSIFGTGLNETPDDFGTRSPLPIHRELLDWLAVEFMEHGWSQKHILKLILSSDAYQRTSLVSPAIRELDPKNQWLARGPRFRTDAEVIRDIALSTSGLLHNRLGGKSVIPPVPQNVLDYNYTYPAYWKPAEGPDRYRRTIYGFRKRSMPDPVASSLDAPNGDFSCAVRVRSNTPLAALTTLNEPIFVEAARALALRILHEGGATDEERIQYGFLLCLSRGASSAEVSVLKNLLKTQRTRIADGWLNARELTTGNAASLPSLPENATPQDAAAWMIVSRVLLNLDETISKN